MSDSKLTDYISIADPKESQFAGQMPVIPTRSVEHLEPPEIPPKRQSRKTMSVIAPNVRQIPPRPPLPKKPKTVNIGESENLYNTSNNEQKIQSPTQSQNFNPFMNTLNGSFCTPASPPALVRAHEVTQKSKTFPDLYPDSELSPSEGSGSASDALRGIESGLRNMERAMQDQLKFKALKVAVAAATPSNQDDYDKNTNSLKMLNCKMLYDRNQSLDDSSDPNMSDKSSSLQPKQYQTNNSSSHKSSTDSPTHNVEYPPRLPNIDHHMRSLDRNLPLELQYTKHRQAIGQTLQIPQQQHNLRLQLEQLHLGSEGKARAKPLSLNADMREQIRQQLLGAAPHLNIVHNTGSTPGSAAAAALLQHQAQSRAVAAARMRNNILATAHFTREELRMRRRSSHDEAVNIGEDQYSTSVPGI